MLKEIIEREDFILSEFENEDICDEEYFKFEKECFHISVKKMKWKTAKKYCKHKNGELMIIEDVNQLKKWRRFFKTNNLQRYYHVKRKKNLQLTINFNTKN